MSRKNQTPLILASASRARRAMLESVGLVFDVHPANIDESGILSAEQKHGTTAPDIAGILAREKALAVSRDNPGALVIGSDQILECEGRLLEKAVDANEAREKLRYLRGRAHRLFSGAAVARDEEILWSHTGAAVLRMHDFTDNFLEKYCARAVDALTSSVGAYEIEGIGAWLFEAVEGDVFTILGMPLLPLLGFLRTECGAGP